MMSRKNTLSIFLFLILLISCSRTPRSIQLQEGKWDPQLRVELNDLMAAYGRGAYAVFDFDQTTIVHDISQVLWVYQIEHLRFASAPDHNFLDGIPTPEDEMPGAHISFEEMGAVLTGEYRSLRASLDAGVKLEAIRASDTYLDFRARMYSLMDAMDQAYGSWVTFLWQPGLLAGFTEAEAHEVIQDALAEHLGREKLAREPWISPDGEWGGEVMRGIWLSPEMKDLYKCLRAAGIDTYVCSASLEMIVEVLACDTELGLGLPEDKVFGLRFTQGNRIIPEFDVQYKQPIKEGKVDNITAYIAPVYENTGPVLVAGDSNGDVPMLTAFPDMRHGLIIDVGRSPESAIGQLATLAKETGNTGIYLLQPSFEQ